MWTSIYFPNEFWYWEVHIGQVYTFGKYWYEGFKAAKVLSKFAIIAISMYSSINYIQKVWNIEWEG